MTHSSYRPSAPARWSRVAAVTALAFGCATVRAPVSTISNEVPVRAGLAEPQLELWLESGGAISPAESAAATAEARAALDAALSRVSAPAGDAILVVRAQGVARTPSRRSDQRAAIAGLVVGAVVVVAAVVIAVVASRGKGGGGAPKLARPAPARAPAVRPAPRPGVPLPVFVPRPHRAGPHVDVAVGVVAGGEAPPPAGGPTAHYVVEPPHAWDPLAAAPGPARAAELAAVSLPPPPALDLADRGYFAGDTLRLELVVVDRRTGAPLWTKEVAGEVDPRDAAAVEQLLAAALADAGGWSPGAGQASAPAAP